jgi:hypothetical protein
MILLALLYIWAAASVLFLTEDTTLAEERPRVRVLFAVCWPAIPFFRAWSYFMDGV